MSIAAINGPQSVVISGGRQAVQTVLTVLQAAGVTIRKLNVSHAFHSPLMEPMLAAFERMVREVRFASPTIAVIANATGELAQAEIATAEYWCRHVRQPVRFAEGIETLHQLHCEVFVEVGPKPTLLGLGRQCIPPGTGVWVPSLRDGMGDWQTLLQSLG